MAKKISGHSGLSKLDDARKHNPPPIKGGKEEQTFQTVSGAGRSKPGHPTKNARKVQPPWKGDSGFEATMLGKGKKK